MEKLEIQPSWPFACNGGKPVASDDMEGMTEEYVYAKNLQLNVWKRTGQPVVDSDHGHVQAATTKKTAVEKERDQPDYDESRAATTYTSSVTKAQGENDQPDPESVVLELRREPLLAATTRLTEASKEHDQPD
jgi:hypothetical protein